MNTILQRPITHPADESGGRRNSLPKIKAPFLLTKMNDLSQPTWIRVWSRRGKRWIVDQELLLDVTRNRSPRDSNVRSNIG
jgi:hypothetical protein